MALYQTTKAPQAFADFGGGLTWNMDPDYHVAPLLPPVVHCTCNTVMDAYTSLLSVASEVPLAPDAIQLDPETLLIAESKLIATLRAYLDPTYSIPTSSSSAIPTSVTRIYIEVATKFVRNRISITDIKTAHMEAALNSSTVTPLSGCTLDAVFETQHEGAPSGTTHIDRYSFKKFKFGDSDAVFIQAQINACEEWGQCGSCASRRRTLQAVKKSDVDLTPARGDMFSPPVQIAVSRFDKTAITFDPIPGFESLKATLGRSGPLMLGSSAGAAPTGWERPVTEKAIRISAQMTLPMSATWAIENKDALELSLRTTLNLLPAEDLVITKITAARRELSVERKLQAASGQGVKIEFTVGIDEPRRAGVTNSALVTLTQGSPAAVHKFAAELDRALESEGKAPVKLAPANINFAPVVKDANAGAADAAWQSSGPSGPVAWQWSPSSSASASSGTTLQGPAQIQVQDDESKPVSSALLFLLVFVGTSLVLAFLCFSRGAITIRQDEQGSHIEFGVSARVHPAPDPKGPFFPQEGPGRVEVHHQDRYRGKVAPVAEE